MLSEIKSAGHDLKLNITVNRTAATLFHDPYLYLEHHFGWMVVTALVIGLAAIIGTLGNLLVIVTVCCVRALRTSGNIFVLNLALADLIITSLIDPFNVIGAVAGRNVLLANPTLCNWVAAFCAPACMSSMWNMCAISLNRYVLICKPHLYPRVFTFRSSILCCICIWILAHLLHLPNHVGWGQNRFNAEYHLCSFDIANHSYGVFYIVTGMLIPLIGVLFGYTAIFLKVRGVKLQIRQHQQSVLIANANVNHFANVNAVVDAAKAKKKRPKKPGFTNEDVKLAKTFFAAFLVFLICWLPFGLFVLAHDPPEIPGWLYIIAIIMAHGNSAVNPSLYGLTNEKFRNGYRNVLGLQKRAVGDKFAVGPRSISYGHRPPPKGGTGSSTPVRLSCGAFGSDQKQSVHPD